MCVICTKGFNGNQTIERSSTERSEERDGYCYTPWCILFFCCSSVNIIHSSADIIEKDIPFYFENISIKFFLRSSIKNKNSICSIQTRSNNRKNIIKLIWVQDIKYNHADWGKPINIYNNLNNSQVHAQDPVQFQVNAQVQVPDPVPRQVQDPIPSQVSTAYISPQAQDKIHAVSQAYNLCSEEKYMLQFMFNRSMSQVNSNQYKPSELEWVQNTILMELVNQIRGLDQEMEHFVNREVDQAQFDDKNTLPNEQINQCMKMYDPNQKQSDWIPYIYNF